MTPARKELMAARGWLTRQKSGQTRCCRPGANTMTVNYWKDEVALAERRLAQALKTYKEEPA
jgi:hypothetical protein